MRIVVNPEAYQIAPNSNFRSGQNIGKFTIRQVNTDNGIVNVLASSGFADIEHENILQVLKSAYSLLRAKS